MSAQNNYLFKAGGNPIITEWTSYTPTSSWGITNTVYTGQWRRVGDTMDVQASIGMSGAPINTSLSSVGLPAGYSIAIAKLSQGSPVAGERPILGQASFSDNGVAGYPGSVFYSSPVDVYVYAIGAGGSFATNNNLSPSIPFTWGAGDRVDIKFSVPIVGW